MKLCWMIPFNHTHTHTHTQNWLIVFRHGLQMKKIRGLVSHIAFWLTQ